MNMTATELFRTLSDPTRRAVFERLMASELSVTDLTAGFSVSQPAISQHLAALKSAGLVSEERRGRYSYYRAEPAALAPLTDWVDRYRTFWPERMEALRGVLKGMQP